MRLCLCVWLLLASSLTATDPAPKPIRLPDVVDPTPAPQPSPNSPIKLDGSRQYVFDADVSCVVVASPPGIVTITKETGPIKIRGLFVGGKDKTESRNYAGKEVYTVEAAGDGTVELLIVPVGADGEDKIVRRQFVVGKPAPVPTPDDGKKKTDPVTARKLEVIVVYDPATINVPVASLMNSHGFWDTIKPYRFVDKNTPEKSSQKYLKEATGTLPQILVRDADADKLLEAVALPANSDGVQALITKHKGN